MDLTFPGPSIRPLVIVESPYAADPVFFTAYAREAIRHSIALGEAPFASHLFYTQVLDDTRPEERALGIRCNLDIIVKASLVAFYIDHGISEGMQAALDQATLFGIPYVSRRLR